MPPNTVDIVFEPENRIEVKPLPRNPEVEQNYGLKITQSFISILAHVLIGIVVGITIQWSFRNGLPLNKNSLHAFLCVIGYQLLMAEAILCLSPEGGWSAKLTLLHKRRVHWILQTVGSALALTGSIIKYLDKSVHFNSWHSRFALIAIICTILCLLNGLTSLYSYELRKVLPVNISKITHICLGIIGFAAASVSLILGYQKNMFANWATWPMTNTIISFTVIFTFIVIVNPSITFINKSRAVLTN